MKQAAKVTAIAMVSIATLGDAKTLTTDPLTGLPLLPATDSRFHLGNEPTVEPETPVCRSKMQTDFYSISDLKASAAVAWYAARLPGFRKTHAYAAGRSQDTFYNSDGTVIVSISGEKGNDGEDKNAYSVTYGRFQPGLSEKSIVSMNQQKIVCN